jgi:hypothetical protein
MPYIGQTWVLVSIGAVVEMGILSTLKRLPMESSMEVAHVYFHDTSVLPVPCMELT